MTQQEAGAALDAKVARILGWEVEVQDIDDDGIPLAVSLSRDDEWLPELPEFSVSHEAAAQIKQFLSHQEIFIEIQSTRTGWVVRTAGHGKHKVKAGSEPLALCRFLARLDSEGVLDHD